MVQMRIRLFIAHRSTQLGRTRGQGRRLEWRHARLPHAHTLRRLPHAGATLEVGLAVQVGGLCVTACILFRRAQQHHVCGELLMVLHQQDVAHLDVLPLDLLHQPRGAHHLGLAVVHAHVRLVSLEVLHQLLERGQEEHDAQRAKGGVAVRLRVEGRKDLEQGDDQEVHVGHNGEELEKGSWNEGQGRVLGRGDGIAAIVSVLGDQSRIALAVVQDCLAELAHVPVVSLSKGLITSCGACHASTVSKITAHSPR
mmetsp:Transcript_21022/g.67765  ORF Transcript_21022/g.67765 Transcript_21022/m.67765 type:complete len:254 (+) Transcript_21022:2176-2937(+)